MNTIDPVEAYLLEAGIRFGDPDYGAQYNLCYASLSSRGNRSGLDERVKRVLESHRFGLDASPTVRLP